MRRIVLSGFLLLASASGWAGEPSVDGWRTWIIPDPAALRPGAPPDAAQTKIELARLVEMSAQRDGRRAAITYWDVGSPSYRWNEIAVDEMIRRGVPTPAAGRHMALLHAAIHDALVAVWDAKTAYARPRPAAFEPGFKAAVPTPASPSYPAEHAAAAAAAAEVLGYLFGDRAEAFRGQALEAAQSRIVAGVQYPSDVEAGLALGREVGMRAVERGKADGFGAKWTGSVPTEPGKWQGVNPLAPMAAHWKTWLLARPDELRSPPPPEPGSPQHQAELAELKGLQRTIPQTSAAWFWEHGAGGFRGFRYWNDQTSRKTLEYRMEPLEAARAFALESLAFHDAVVACWDGKYHYWRARPFMADPELNALFPAPNHPSYPAAHGCLSTAAAAALAKLFPDHAQVFEAKAEEAAEARIWAGIHYRSDIEAGKTIGRAVAEKALAASQAR